MVMINSVQGNLPASVIPRHAIGDRSPLQNRLRTSMVTSLILEMDRAVYQAAIISAIF
jgi:hypothetical protein